MKLSELFPRKYATGDDLRGRPWTVTIAKVVLEDMRPQPGAPPQRKPVLYIKGGRRGIVLSRTLAHQIAAIVGSDETDDWPGQVITIYPEPILVAGQERIAIRARRPELPFQKPAPEPEEEEPEEEEEEDEEAIIRDLALRELQKSKRCPADTPTEEDEDDPEDFYF